MEWYKHNISNIICVWSLGVNKCIDGGNIRIGIASSQTIDYVFTKDSASSKHDYHYVFNGNVLFYDSFKLFHIGFFGSSTHCRY